MALTPEEAEELRLLEIEVGNPGQLVDVAPYFYNNQLSPPPPPPGSGLVSGLQNVGEFLTNPLVAGGIVASATPLYNTLTAERDLVQELFPDGPDGKKKKNKISPEDARKTFNEAPGKIQAQFDAEQKLKADAHASNLQQVTQEVNALLPEQQAKLQIADQNLQHKKKDFLDTEATRNALANGELGPVDSSAQDFVNTEVEAKKLSYENAQKLHDIELKNLNDLNQRVTSAQTPLVQDVLPPQSLIQADIDALAGMGVEAPDVAEELKNGDIEGARKKMSAHLDSQLKSKVSFIKDIANQMRTNPKGILKSPKKLFTGKGVKRTLGHGVIGGSLGYLGPAGMNAMSYENIDVDAERKNAMQLGKMAERYNSPFATPDQTLLNPLVPEQKKLIDDIKTFHGEPRGYLLGEAGNSLNNGQ
jgi:ribosomal protein L13E